MTLAWVARFFIFLHVGIPVLLISSIVYICTPGTDTEDWAELFEWVWTVEYARD